MNKLIKIFTVFTIIIILASCEAQMHILVTVVDENTGKPLEGVFVEAKAGKDNDYTKNYASGYTDSTGKFETYMMVGCAFGCYDILMEYKKDGYEFKSEMNEIEKTVKLKMK